MSLQVLLHNVDSDEDIFVLFTDKNGTIVSINDMLCKNCGYDYSELIGESLNSLFHSESYTVLDDVLNTVKDGKPWEGYLKKPTKSGESFWVHSTIGAIGEDDQLFFCCRRALNEEITEI